MKMILRGQLVFAPRLGVLETWPGGCLILEDGVVQDIVSAPPSADLPVEDYKDCLIIPSFADLHLHAPQFPMLGLGMDRPLLEWLAAYTFKTEARFGDTAYARRISCHLAKTLLRYGTTRAALFSSWHTDSTLVLMEELENAGITGYVGKVNMDRNSGEAEENTAASISETERWLDGCRFPHIQPILTPRFTPACTNELMAYLGALAETRKLPIQSHLSENIGEIAWVRKLHPDCGQYWETYHKYGLWRRGTLMAHCVYSDPQEQEAMAAHGIWAVHCPTSNNNLCSGQAPVRELLRRGIPVALGSDIAGGDTLSMSRVAVEAIRTSKVRYMQSGEAFLTVPEAFYLATTAGHQYFGGGAFTIGKPLHALVVDDKPLPEPARLLSLEERLERVLYLFDQVSLRAVYSEGCNIL